MRTEFIELLKNSVGQHVEGQAVGFGAWLNARIEEVGEDGHIVVSYEVRDDLLNPMGIIHGGAVSAMVDEIMGMQLFIFGKDAEAYVALNLNVDFLAKATPGDRITLRPKLIRKGRKIAHMNCEVYRTDGKLIAKAASNFARIDI